MILANTPVLPEAVGDDACTIDGKRNTSAESLSYVARNEAVEHHACKGTELYPAPIIPGTAVTNEDALNNAACIRVHLKAATTRGDPNRKLNCLAIRLEAPYEATAPRART